MSEGMTDQMGGETSVDKTFRAKVFQLLNLVEKHTDELEFINCRKV